MTEKLMMRPYGLWDSPISPRGMASRLSLTDVQWDSTGQTLVWLEGRAGQQVLVSASIDGCDAPRDLTVDLAVRARVGYGGGEFTVTNGHVFFVEKSGRIYRQSLDTGPARAITPEFGHAAAPAVSSDGRWMLYVHTYEHQDCIAIVDAEGEQWPQRLATGHDFYMQPRWHPQHHSIAFIAWDHPQMPWDGTLLYLARLRAGTPPSITQNEVIAGGSGVAIFQPEFSPDGQWLAYVSDESGWSQIYLYDIEQGTHRQLTRAAAEHSRPAWVQGMRTYGWSYDSRSIFFVRNEQGFGRLYRQEIDSEQAEPVIGLESYTWIEQPAVSPTQEVVAALVSSSDRPARLVTTGATPARLFRRTETEAIAPAQLAPAQPVTWEAADGAQVYGLLYLPSSQRFESSGRPPAIIKIHGGPTSQVSATYDPQAQFFTTRGYALLVVNYRGSTGYGRAYMEALRGTWGIADVADAVSGAHYLADQGFADAGKIVIMGGSAGGYTVLEALCQSPGVFKAGICLFGVSNLFTLAAETHKFEERYLDSLLGPLPEASAIYRERSPIFHVEKITDPVAVFQGDIDEVVPRNQSDSIVESLRRRGVPHVYHVYEGEGHGWRKPETIEQFYKSVDAFLRQYVLFA